MEKITLAELGRLFKKKFPAYSDWLDEEVGLYLVENNPKDYAHRVSDIESTHAQIKNVHTQNEIEAVKEKVKNYRGKWYEDFLGFEESRTTRRNQWREKAAVEIESIHHFENKEKQLHQSEQLNDADHEANVANNKAFTARWNLDVTNAEKGLSTSAADTIATDRARTKAEAKREVKVERARGRSARKLIAAELDKEQKLISARFEDHERREQMALANKPEYDKLELDKRWQEINQDLNAATIFALSTLKTAEQMRLYLSECYGRLDKLEKRKSKAAKREFAILSEHVEQIEAKFRGTPKLLQSATQADTGTSDESPEFAGDLR